MKKIALIAPIALFALAGVFAADASASLSLSDARTLALANSAAVKKAELDVQAARLENASVKADFLPSLSAQGSLSAAYPDDPRDGGFDTSAGYGLSVSQTLFSGGSRIASLRGSAVRIRDAEEALRSARLSILAAADERYLAVLEKTLSREAAGLDLEASARRLDLARARHAAGRIDLSSLLEAESSYAAKRSTALQARYDAEIARRSLSSLIGEDSERELAPVDGSVYAAVAEKVKGLDAPGLESLALKLTARGEENNPDLRRKSLAVDSGLYDVQARKAAFFPTVSLGWSHSWSGSGEGGMNDSGRVTVSGSIPLLPWTGRSAAVKKAETAARSAGLERDDARDAYRLSVFSTLLDLAAAAGKREAAAASLSYAERHYEGVFERFRLSAASVSELADAEALLSTARSSEIAGRFALYRAWRSLLYLAGEENETDLLALATA